VTRLQRRGGERGYVLAVAAMVLVPLVLAAGFAVDIGAWYADGLRMQRAADAAALAGVTWLPDLDRAGSVARSVARQNGFDDADPDIAVTVRRRAASRLEVRIDRGHAAQYFSSLVVDGKSIRRTAVAEYTAGVPLGSPRNYIGTGSTDTGGAAPEGFYLAINGYCALKENGDPFAPGFEGNDDPRPPYIRCPAPTPNRQHTAAPQYTYTVDVPAGRVDPIEVRVFSPWTNQTPPIDPSDRDPFSTTFTVRAPDGTPFNDADNPLARCTGAGEANPTVADDDVDPSTVAQDVMFGRPGWLRVCTIASTSPPGTYLVQVGIDDDSSTLHHHNTFGLVATYSGRRVACDSRTDPQCPRVAAKDWLSIYADTGSPQAEFYLADVPATAAGRKMSVTMFDPGEGGQLIRIIDPAGHEMPFTWKTLDGRYVQSSPVTALDVSGCDNQPQIGPGRGGTCKFNERWVQMSIDLPADYATRYPTDHWWRIKYEYSSTVTDRTTISVTIGGTPVHLVE